MNLLAFETATRRVSVALSADGAITSRSEDLPNSGSEVLLPWACELLAAAGIRMADLDAIAFGAGPGGFTGLRLACGVTQGLAFGLDIPVIPVSTLAALALNAGEGVVWTVLDARMNEVYSATYRVRGDSVEELMSPVCVAPEIAVPSSPTFDPLIAAGDGFAAYCERMAVQLSSVSAIRADLFPDAVAVARLAAQAFAHGEAMPAAAAQPIYVREKVALTTAERLARGGVR